MNSSPRRPGKGLALFAIAAALVAAAPLIGSSYAEGHALDAVRHAAADEPTAATSDRASLQGASPGSRASAEDEARRFAFLIERASRAHGVDAALVHAVILAESSYNPDARSPAGAAGLMQLMPLTAKHYGVVDLFDPNQNIQGGVKFLRDLLRQFDGNIELALAAYNAGTTAVIRAGHRVPPLAETQAYVPKVIDHYRRLRALEG